MVMLSCLGGQPCELSKSNDCGNDFAYVFFIVFYILTTILVSDCVKYHNITCTMSASLYYNGILSKEKTFTKLDIDVPLYCGHFL